MINLTDNERGRLQKLNQDKITIEGLKKVFLNSFLKNDIMQDVNALAASYLAIHFLEKGFRDLLRIQDGEKQENKPENPAL